MRHQNFREHIKGCCSNGSLFGTRNEKFGIDAYGAMNRIYALYFARMKRDFPMFTVTLTDFRCQNSFDPCDKIYGMLGLSDHAWAGRIEPDYTVTTEALYRCVLSTAIDITGNLNILSHCQGKGEIQGLPSFVPDWTAQIDDFLREASRLRMVAMSIYNTLRGSQAEMRWINTITAVSKGHIVDCVVGVAPGPYRSKQLFPAELWDSWLQLIRDHCNFEHSTLAPIDWSSTPLGDSTHETEAVLQQDPFWATMCGGLSFAMDEQNHSRSWCRVIQETGFPIFKRWHAWVLSWFDTKLHNSGVRLFPNNHTVTAEGRQFAVTEKGFIGWVPLDVVAVLAGGKVPYVLRLCEDMGVGDKDQAPRYRFLGDAYVHGIRDGETVDEGKGIQGEIWLV